MRQLGFWGGPSIVLNVLQVAKKKDKNHVPEISGHTITCGETFLVITRDMSLSYQKRKWNWLASVIESKAENWHSCWLIVVDGKPV